LVSRVCEQSLDELNLNYRADDDDGALDDGPSLNVTRVTDNQIEVPRLCSFTHGLELSHYLNSLIDTPECAGEVLHCHVHVLEFLRELLPLVVSEGGEVEVDQLGREPGELVVQTDAVVTSLGHVALLVL